MNKICILGCGGFIGSHLLERLLADDKWLCVGLDEHDAKIRHLLQHPRFRFVKGDVYTLPGTAEIIQDSDVVVSLTAICNPVYYNTEPLRVIAANYDHPARITAECARLGKRLVHFSTSEVYGKTPAALGLAMTADEQVMREEDTHLILGPVARQRWSYACAKQLMERVIYAYGAEQGLAYTIVRPFNFVGARMDYIPGVDGDGLPRVTACFMDSLMFNKPLRVVDGGHNRRVFTYIADAVDAVVRILERPEAANRRTFNIGNPDNELCILELAERLTALYPAVARRPVGSRSRIVTVAGSELYGPGYDDSDRRLPDISLARALLGWQPRVGIEETLRRTMEAFVNQYQAEPGQCHP